VVVIGPCVSGKSTVAAALRERGIEAHSVAQEHSVVPDLWRNQRPHLLVYLDVSYEEAARRRDISWGPERHEGQKHFMRPARAATDLIISTDGLSVEDVVALILEALTGRSV
jgi:thymidylate kinase